MVSFHKWTDIDSLAHVMRSRNQSEWMKSRGPITYRGKIKLHGTNAAIRITPDGVFPQSRSQIISVQQDNAGFAIWLESKKHLFHPHVNAAIEMDQEVTVYGEWCGPGIQKGVAVSQIPHKVFAIFGFHFHKSDLYPFEQFTVDPHDIHANLYIDDPTIKILPWATEPIKVDFEKADSVAKFVEHVNGMVEECETVDPWVKENYGIEGPGEGYVYYSVDSEDPYYKGFMFKAKGEAHRVNKTKTAAQVNPDILRSVEAFRDFAVTLPRLEQGFKEAVGEVADPKLTGDFLSWVMKDILKECTVELADSGLTWKQVVGACSKAARDWYIEKTKEVVL